MSLRAPPAKLERREFDRRQNGDRHGRGTAADDRASGGVSQGNSRGWRSRRWGVAGAADNQRYEHISRVLARFDCPQRNKRQHRAVLPYLQRTHGNARAQLDRQVARWAVNRVAQTPLLRR